MYVDMYESTTHQCLTILPRTRPVCDNVYLLTKVIIFYKMGVDFLSFSVKTPQKIVLAVILITGLYCGCTIMFFF